MLKELFRRLTRASSAKDLSLRDQHIARVVAGKSFAEVGGLWGTVNEKISVAHRNGAISLTMIDATPDGADLWKEFDSRMREMSIADYRCISADICELDIEELGQPFDVVHCSGVLYHHPNPMLVLAALRKITREYLILTSAITREVIDNRKGRCELPSSGVIFVPALSGREREVLSAYWREQRGVRTAYGLTEEATYHLTDFGPWWWLPTARAMLAMCETVGFKVVAQDRTWNGNALTALLEA